MKALLLLGLLVLSCGCNFFPKPKPPAKDVERPMIDEAGWVPTGNDDLDTIATSLLDFMKQGRMTNLVDGMRTTVVVHRQTNGPGDVISSEQIASETRRMTVPIGSVASLQARNADVHEMTLIPPGLPFFVSDLGVLPEDLTEMARAMPNTFPKSFAAVWLWMPGYSEDGAWAMVRFTFAPTANGAVATYILFKDETGKWRISNRGLNYFVAPVG